MLVYGREPRLPMSLKFPSLELSHQLELVEDDDVVIRMAEWMELEEKRQQALETLDAHHQQVKKSFNKRAITKKFKEGDLVLKWDVDIAQASRHSKFNALWSGPYIINSCKEFNVFQLSRPTGEILPILVNGIHIKLCL